MQVGVFLLSSVSMAPRVHYRHGSTGFGRRKFVVRLMQGVRWNVNKDEFG